MNNGVRTQSFCIMAVLAAIFLACVSTRSSAEELPLVHPLFSDHVVIQRGMKAPIWGWAKPGEKVQVTTHRNLYTTTAKASGKWQMKLGPYESGEPITLTVKSGTQTVKLVDVCFGDVWICSGQSNMQWTVSNSNDATSEIASADHPSIRLFHVPRRVAMSPETTVNANWMVCTPETIPDFSAVAYYFGRELQQRLDVPIGLIHTSWGGTVAEAWTSAGALGQMPDFKQQLSDQRRMANRLDAGLPSFDDRVAVWWQNNGFPQADSLWNQIEFDDSKWKTMELPELWESAEVGLDDYDGVVLFRREFELSADAQGMDATLTLGRIDDIDTTWVNGQMVGRQMRWNQNRKYRVPSETLKPGKNVVSIGVVDFGQGGGVYPSDQPMQMTFGKNSDDAAKMKMDGEWRFLPTKPLEELSEFPKDLANNQNTVTVLNNGMLAPLVPYGIKGAIWYQGESNAGRPEQYGRLLPTMIKDWRSQFRQGDFPFLIVQLANFRQLQTKPVEIGSWAEIREAQAMTAESDPHVGLAVTTDIGEADDIHPRNKQEVGNRLALSALSIAYDEKLVPQGPTFQSMKIEGGQLRIAFDEVGDELKSTDGGLKGFAIAGEDRMFVWATAKIDGNEVVLSADEVSAPKHARYNWANNPVGNLFNEEGLPAAPFRTDKKLNKRQGVIRW